MNRIFILFIINNLLKLFAISTIIDYYYNFNNIIFDNFEKVIEIDIENNINFNKII